MKKVLIIAPKFMGYMEKVAEELRKNNSLEITDIHIPEYKYPNLSSKIKNFFLKKTEKERLYDYNLLMKEYLSADVEQIRKTDEQLTGKLLPKALWAKIKIQLMDERNKKMAIKIKELAQDKQLFIAVGASHLSGKDGLLSQLRDSGFKLTPLKAFE